MNHVILGKSRFDGKKTNMFYIWWRWEIAADPHSTGNTYLTYMERAFTMYYNAEIPGWQVSYCLTLVKELKLQVDLRSCMQSIIYNNPIKSIKTSYRLETGSLWSNFTVCANRRDDT